MRYLVLSNTKERAIVDDKNFEYLNQWRWHVSDRGYAVRRPKVDGKSKTIYLHRVVMETPSDLFVDHINRNRLDNRKINLRNVTWKENRQNIGVHRDSRTGQKNIDLCKGGWRLRIQRYGEMVVCTMFETLDEAVECRDNYYARRFPHSGYNGY